MKATLRRGAAVTLTALALGTGLAACGGGNGNSGNPPASTGSTVAGASASANGSASSGSPAAPASGTASAPAAGSSVGAATMTQKLQQAAQITKSAHVVLSIDAAGQSIKGQGDVETKPLAEDLTMSVMGTHLEVRLVDATFYVKLPASAGLGKTWLEATPQQLGSASGMGSLGSMGDPLALFTKIGGALRGSTYVGTDSTGEHYIVKVDSMKMLHIMGVAGARLSQLKSVMPGTVTEDVWFDTAGHVVKVKVGLGASGATTVTMSDFGKPVHVQAPPAGETRDIGRVGSLTHA